MKNVFSASKPFYKATFFSLSTLIAVTVIHTKVSFDYIFRETGILSLFLFIGLYVFYITADKRKTPTTASAINTFISGLLAAIVVVGETYSESPNLEPLYGSWFVLSISIIRILGYTFLFRNAIILGAHYFSNRKIPQDFCDNPDNKIGLLKIGAITILFFWLIQIIIYFPGTLMWDSFVELNQFFGLTPWTNHHPAFPTVVMGLCMNIGRNIFFNDNIGIFIYVIMQTIIIWLIVTKSLSLMLRLSAPKWLYWITVGYFSIFSVWPAYIQCESKDTLYFSFVLLYIIFLIEIMLEPNKFFNSLKSCLLLGLDIMILSLYRNNGIFVFLLSFPFIIFIYKKYRKKTLFIFCMLFLLYTSINNFLLPLNGIQPGSKKEILSIPFQQTARYVTYNNDIITTEERVAINRVLELDSLSEIYNPIKSDPVKDTYKCDGLSSEEEKEALKEYFKVWFKGLLKAPMTYIEATLQNIYGYFYPSYLGYEYGFYDIESDTRVNTGYFDISHNSYFDSTRTTMERFIAQVRTFPIVRLLYSCGTYTWILIILALFIIFEKNKIKLIPLLPSFITLLVCMASPVNAYIRYDLPIMASIPLLISWVWSKKNKL